MIDRIFNWLNNNVDNTFDSPRKEAFNSKVLPFKIVSVDRDKQFLLIKFIGGVQSLPLHFWMFHRAFDYLFRKKYSVVRLGAKLSPPYDDDTIEGQIWKKPFAKPPNTPFKASPHICDILVLLGVAQYEKTKSPLGRSVQGIRYRDNLSLQPEEASIIPPQAFDSPSLQHEKLPIQKDEKAKFCEKFRDTIVDWTENRKDIIVNARLAYSWQNKPTIQCVKERNEVSKAIILSRIENQGGIDLDTLDKVTKWGFNREFPSRNQDEAIKITRKAFNELDNENLIDATKILLGISGVGISRASKILGLFDQENLCIYDSRVGNALDDLKCHDKKIVLCPPGRNRNGDYVSDSSVWAYQYQRLIWTLEIMRDYLNENKNTFRLADVEMGLFMIGK